MSKPRQGEEEVAAGKLATEFQRGHTLRKPHVVQESPI